MIDFARLRQSMVDSQIRANDVTDPRILAAMLELPRERFAPEDRRGLAYIDDDLPLGASTAGKPGRYLVEPMVLAKLVQALDIDAEDRVLDVGTATGYSAALLGRLAGKVVALEEDAGLAATAAKLLADLDAVNVRVATGPLNAGWRAEAPYDAILAERLGRDRARGVLEPAGVRAAGSVRSIAQTAVRHAATIYTRVAGSVAARPVFDAAVPPFAGFRRRPKPSCSDAPGACGTEAAPRRNRGCFPLPGLPRHPRPLCFAQSSGGIHRGSKPVGGVRLYAALGSQSAGSRRGIGSGVCAAMGRREPGQRDDRRRARARLS